MRPQLKSPTNHPKTATNHATRLAIQKLKQCYMFDVEDFNLSSIHQERKKWRKSDIKQVEKQMTPEALNDN